MKINLFLISAGLLSMSTSILMAAPADNQPVNSGVPVVESYDSSTSAAGSNIIELLNRLDQLQKELRQVRGEMEVVNHELSGIKRRQRELYLDMDRRLSDVELAGVNVVKPDKAVNTKSTAAAKATANETAKAQATTGQKLPPTRDEKDAYRGAFNMLKEGRYDRSIKAFTGFLKKYPNSTYADNAQYWLGEANYVSRKYKNAVSEFGRVISVFPDSTKVPDAMLKLGFTHYELKQWTKSREMLEAVMKNYPKSSAAKLAGTRLKRMTQDGH